MKRFFPLLCALAIPAPAFGQAVVLNDLSVRSAGVHPHADFGGNLVLDGQRLFVAMRDEEMVQVFRDQGSGYVLETEFTAPDGFDGDWFGFSLAASGSTCVVGAPHHDSGGTNAGAAYVFTHDGTAWGFEQKLLPSTHQPYDRFGTSVACIGNRIAVGSPLVDLPGQDDQGRAFVFDRTGAPWSEVASLTGPDSVGGDHFGYRVALSGPTLIVNSETAHAGYPYSGATYSFLDTGGGPVFEHKFVPPVVGETFGHALDISGDRLAAGMPYGGADGAGVVCVFERTAGTWGPAVVLNAPYGAGLDQLGFSVALSGDRLVTGVFFDWIWADWSGSALVFEKVGAEWKPQLRLIPRDGLENGGFGQAIDFDGTRIAVGAPHWGGGSGTPVSHERVYLFEHSDRVGTAVCVGDGSGIPCPCGNESPVGYDMGCENAYNRAANLAGSGSASVSADDLALSVEHLTRAGTFPPVGVYVQLLAGTGLLSGVTIGDGLRCVGGSVIRVGPTKVATNGGLSWWGPGLISSAGWSAGETIHFQVFYRDPAQGACGTHVNTSNALSVTFTQ